MVLEPGMGREPGLHVRILGGCVVVQDQVDG